MTTPDASPADVNPIIHGIYLVDTGDPERDRSLSQPEVDHEGAGIVEFPAALELSPDSAIPRTVNFDEDETGIELDVTASNRLVRIWLLSPADTLGRGALRVTLRDLGEWSTGTAGSGSAPRRYRRWILDIDPASLTGPPIYAPTEGTSPPQSWRDGRVLLTVSRRADGAALAIVLDLLIPDAGEDDPATNGGAADAGSA